MCSFFSPELLQAGAVNGVKASLSLLLSGAFSLLTTNLKTTRLFDKSDEMPQNVRRLPILTFLSFFLNKKKEEVFSTSLSLAGNSGHLTWVRHIPISVCSIFVCPKKWCTWLSVFEISDVHTVVDACDCIVQRGCTDTVRESLHWKLTLGEKKISCRTWDSNQRQY